MEHASVDDILDRFKQAAKVTTDADLAKVLGLSRQSIAAARLRAKIPASWFPKISSLFNISTEWLYRGETAQECEKIDVCVNMETDICSQLVALRTYCDKIERKLENFRIELNLLQKNKPILLKSIGLNVLKLTILYILNTT